MTIETANRLYELRKTHGLSQEELAEKLEISRQAVSKWERCETSPDTDNLIALAKLYGLSLDELIYGERDGNISNDIPINDQENDSKESEETKTESSSSENDKKVQIEPSGIVVDNGNGQTVKIGFSGINIETLESNTGDFDNDESDEKDEDVIVKDGRFHVEIKKPENKVKFWLEVPYPIICTIFYLIFGFLDIWGGWTLSWIIFITIPIYYSLVEAIYKRSISEFGAYPILTAFIFLYLGLYHSNWHPSWIVFMTVPVYFSIANALDKKFAERKKEKS